MKVFHTFLLISFVSIFLGCSENNAQKNKEKDSLTTANTDVFTDHILDSTKCGLIFKATGNYNAVKSEILYKKELFKRAYLNETDNKKKVEILDSARLYFTEALLNKLIPYWYGTVWDFNGYTDVPNSGVIACGYFISTTLKHMGLHINRYKFAQQAGLNEAKTLDPSRKYKVYNIHHAEGVDSVVNILEKEFKAGLYTVGLSNHVGYIYVKDKTAYFIHSNYIDGYVMTEKARYSYAFVSSVYVFSDITHNDYLINSWILNKEIPVVTN